MCIFSSLAGTLTMKLFLGAILAINLLWLILYYKKRS